MTRYFQKQAAPSMPDFWTPERQLKALKLLEALGARCDESKGDHKWRKCNHCITVNWLAFGGDDAPRKMLRDVAAALRTAGDTERGK